MEIALTISKESARAEICIFRDRSSPTGYKEYTLSVIWNGEEKMWTFPPSEVQYLFDAVRAARISPYPVESVFMLDTLSYQLTLGEGRNQHSYFWTPPCSNDWMALDEIKDMLIEFAQRYTGMAYYYY